MLATLFGNKVDLAIERFKEFEPFTEGNGFFLAFSGGKDSVVIERLAQMSGVKYDSHYNVTTVDPPELLRFIKDYHPNVAWSYPPMTMWQLIVKKRMPPTRRVRYCCDVLKEQSGSGRVVVTGVRWAESCARSKRRLFETCYRDAGTRYLHPIIDWTDAELWEFIRGEKIPYCSLYDEGFKRLGCIGCPMAGKNRWKEFARWPHYEKMYRRAFQRAVEKRDRDTAAGTFKSKATVAQLWTDGEAMFDWWMNENRQNNDDGGLFEEKIYE